MPFWHTELGHTLVERVGELAAVEQVAVVGVVHDGGVTGVRLAVGAVRGDGQRTHHGLWSGVRSRVRQAHRWGELAEGSAGLVVEVPADELGAEVLGSGHIEGLATP
ncbi:hypothetical protein GCM10029964_077540 [Kibdelosporangium lantanae]